MRNALAVRHVAFEDLGLLAEILPRFDYRIDYLEAGREHIADERLQQPDLLVVLGGPISANDDRDYPFQSELRQALAGRIESRRPTLGICLGAQVISRTLGSAVYAGKAKEIGWSTLELTAAGHRSCLRHLHDVPVLHWHGETFDLPVNAEHLASTEVCMNQAFSIDNYLLGLQFHPEVTVDGLESWYIGHTLELSGAGIDITQLRHDSRRHAPALRSAADAMFTEWLQQITY